MTQTAVSAEQFDRLVGLDDWSYIVGSIRAQYRLGSFASASALIAEIGQAADDADHHPELSVRHPGVVEVDLSTHSSSHVSDLDVAMARTISALAVKAGATSEPMGRQAIEFAIDTMNPDAIRPFWQAVLDYRNNHGYLFDPRSKGPSLWFQQMTEPRSERSRFHLDVSVPPQLAEERVAAALAAGGTLVTNEYARSWWVLADADGNEVCVCTWLDRDGS